MDTTQKRPLISVIIPAYNHEKFIGAAIESVLKQTITDFELLIIDDGSTDKTAQVVKSYSDSRLHYYHQENQDAYNTINRGLDMAGGEYISILNSDDIYSINRFEKILDFIKEKKRKNQEIAAVITDVIPISDTDTIFTDPHFGWNEWHNKNRAFYFKTKDIYTAFLKGNFMVTTSNLFMTRNAAKTVGHFAALRYFHDYDYIFRLMLSFPQGVYYMHDEKLLSYRIHPGNTLGEAAIIGRRQDQELISKYMCAVVSEELQKKIQAGAERLTELGEELYEVRTQQELSQVRGVKQALKELARSVFCSVKQRIVKREK